MIKPGYKTSEFWFTLVSFIFSGLYLIGLFGEDIQQKDDLIRDISHGVESIILIGGQLAILWKYVNSRKEIKQTWFSIAAPEEKTVTNKKNAEPLVKKAKKPTKTKTIKKTKNTKPK